MDTTTALTLVIPLEFHDKINQIRKLHDKAYPRWMPHINFFFPFVNENEFRNICNILEPKLRKFGTFDIELDDVGFFDQGNISTIHLKPSNPTKLKELFKLIEELLPNVKSKHSEFNPHMTIAQFATTIRDAKMKEIKDWLSQNKIKFTVDDICILNRDKKNNSEPFSVHTVISLS